MATIMPKRKKTFKNIFLLLVELPGQLLRCSVQVAKGASCLVNNQRQSHLHHYRQATHEGHMIYGYPPFLHINVYVGPQGHVLCMCVSFFFSFFYYLLLSNEVHKYISSTLLIDINQRGNLSIMKYDQILKIFKIMNE